MKTKEETNAIDYILAMLELICEKLGINEREIELRTDSISNMVHTSKRK